jgi:hypothetical protein
VREALYFVSDRETGDVKGSCQGCQGEQEYAHFMGINGCLMNAELAKWIHIAEVKYEAMNFQTPVFGHAAQVEKRR